MSQKTANTMYIMHRAGFGLIGGSADSKESLHWQLSAGAEFVSGTAVGMPASEDALIRDCLLKERGS